MPKAPDKLKVRCGADKAKTCLRGEADVGAMHVSLISMCPIRKHSNRSGGDMAVDVDLGRGSDMLYLG